jgi:hypothetical protein
VLQLLPLLFKLPRRRSKDAERFAFGVGVQASNDPAKR